MLAAILLILAYPKFNLEFLAWVALVPWLFAIDGVSKGKAFLYSYLVGIIFFAGAIYWLHYVTLWGLIVLILYLAVYFGLFGLFALRLPLVLLPCLWVVLEFLRGSFSTGFGWAFLGYSQYLNLPIIQIADLTGVYGVSFLIVLVNAAVFGAIKRKRYIVPLALVIVLAVLAYGYYRLTEEIPEPAASLKISVVQGNISQEQKWDEEFKDSILEKYEQLTYEANLQKPDLIIWPETAVPGYLDEQNIRERIAGLAKSVKVPLLVGAPSYMEPRGAEPRTVPPIGGTGAWVNGKYYNSAFLISGQGKILKQYDKVHLVPFGEYIPLEAVFGLVRQIAPAPIGEFSPGREYTVFEIERAKFGVLICFEDIFPGLVRQFVLQGADFLVNITNDAWFGNTSAPFQHAQASVFRAVENRVNLVRSANTGYSCFIDSRGRIVASVSEKLMVGGAAAKNIILGGISSFYTRWGDIFVLLCFCALSIYGVKGFILTR